MVFGFLAVNVPLSWNVRGLGCSEKKRIVRFQVEKHKPIFLFIRESKLANTENGLVRTLGRTLLSRAMVVDAEGLAGGLITRDPRFSKDYGGNDNGEHDNNDGDPNFMEIVEIVMGMIDRG
ncbi:hypothetical protein LWI28_025431 [Acer negundo]|uniref:Uncharacterized protein n=1 Tax=Acer negundo TaxID=4023 RepID=A0AAD5J171_ACENE|nr:hypothetical protein LWI28_025431 [Acer negundo]